MRQAEKEKKKKFLIPNSVHTGPGQENSEKIFEKNSKNYKTSSLHSFFPKLDETRQKREKKIIVSNSVHARPGQENSEKYIKKIQKIIKPFPAIIFS